MSSKIFNREGLYRTRIGRYYPRYYEKVLETDELIKTENETFDWLFTVIQQSKLNQFIAYADETGISAYEQLFQIPSDPSTETLEQRRFRLLNRVQTLSYFTMNYLREKLDTILGPNNYEITMDYNTYTLYVLSSVKNSFLYNEVGITINKIKPANIVFVNVPMTVKTIGVSSEVYSQKWWWNYIPSKWVVGQKPIISIQDLQKVKGKGVSTLTETLMNYLKEYIAELTTKVLINNSIEVTDFVQKLVTGGYLKIQFKIPNWEETPTITNLKLLDSKGLILSNDTVYIPIKSDSMVEYRIYVNEVLTNE